MSIEVKLRHNSIEKCQTKDKCNEETYQLDIREIEKDLNKLRKQYSEMKRERKKSQKDEKLLSNKMGLLSKEEIKVYRRQQMHIYTQENMDKIKVNLLQDKERLNSVKRNRREQLNEKRKEISRRKSYINLTLKSWRSNLELCKKNEGQKTKEEQNEIQEKILLNKEAIRQRHQSLHDKVQMSQRTIEEKRKKEEIEKKLKLKKAFEEKIMNEESFKKQLDKNINDFQEETMHIVERIHNIDLSFKNSFILSKENRNSHHHNANPRSSTHHSINSSCSKNNNKE